MSSDNPDPLKYAASKLFAVPYLYPYQRLVISNILEAAAAKGIQIRWPGENGENSDSDNRIGNDNYTENDGFGRQIVILPTGAGKSLCFQLPAMLMEKPTLVIYPLLGLMADQERRLIENGFSPVILRGGQSQGERDLIWDKIKTGKSKFIIANPEVLLTPPVLSRLKELNIAHIVIDEAHCVSEWGESFRPAYLEIGKIIEAIGSPLVTAFTATAGVSVLDKIEKYIFGSTGARRITGNPDRKNISYSAKGCILKNLAVRDLVFCEQRPIIVFCSSRPGTESLARYLLTTTTTQTPGNDLSLENEIRFYHAGLSREEKKETEEWFLNSNRAILTATCAYGLGIDKPDIRTVIHRDSPPSVEAYLQESGRAGRDSLASKAIFLWGPEDEVNLKRAKTEIDKKRISSLLAYARNTLQCRREALLKLLDYEGEMDNPGQSCCDVCDKKSSVRLREESSLVDFFRRNSRSYSIQEAGKVLSLAGNINWTGEDAEEAINYLIGAGKLKKQKNPLWKDKLVINPNLPDKNCKQFH
jgi:ATP-dependent DNA helicase RecQ